MTTQFIRRPAAFEYSLGHHDAELARLERQSESWSAFTERFLREAGIREGMRVLDVGTGAGDVALAAARIVGPSGCVLGVDRAVGPTVLAARRAERAGLRHVEFCTGDVTALRAALGSGVPSFDAAIGRFVLLHLADPVAALRESAALVRAGGVVAFLEYDFTATTVPNAIQPAVPLFTEAIGRAIAALAAAGADVAIGGKFRRHFRDAGLPEPLVNISAIIQGGPQSFMYEMVADVTRSLLPVIERAGLGTAADIDVDTLAARLRAAVMSADASARSPDLVAAWCTLPNG